MKKVILLSVLVLGLGMSQMQAQNGATETESPKKENVFRKIMNDLKESTRSIHEMSKENFATEKAALQTRHAKATEPNEDFLKFLEKIQNKLIAQNSKESNKEYSEKDKELLELINLLLIQL